MRLEESREKTPRVLEMWDKGLSQVQIRIRLGVTASWVSSVLKKAGRETGGKGGWAHRNVEAGYAALGGSTGYQHRPHFIEHGNGQQEGG